MNDNLHFFICHYKPNTDRRNYIFDKFVESKKSIHWITEYGREEIEPVLDKYYSFSEQEYFEIIVPIGHILIGNSFGVTNPQIPWQDCFAYAMHWIKSQGDAWESKLPLLFGQQRLFAIDVGIWLAHRRAWECIIESNLDYGCVLEDDFMVCEDSLQRLDDLMQGLPAEWDYIDIAGGAGLYIREETPVSSNLYRMDPPRNRTVCGYLISRKFCERILQTDCPIALPIDWQLCYFFSVLDAKVFWAEPSIFIHGSEMGHYVNSRK
jgi:hypothetical protein